MPAEPNGAEPGPEPAADAGSGVEAGAKPDDAGKAAAPDVKGENASEPKADTAPDPEGGPRLARRDVPAPMPSISPGPVPRPPGSSRQRAIRAALATLPVPEPGPSFWADLDAALSEQGHLAITARPAIRPISEPPPLSQPRLGDHLAQRTPAEAVAFRAERELVGGREGGSGSGSRRGVVVAVIAVLVGLLVLGTLLGDDSEDPSTTGSSTSTTLAEGEVTTTATGPTATTQPQIPGLEPEAPLTAGGVGPVQVGMTRRDLQQQGVETTVDEASFQSGEGRCFSGAVPAAPDLVLWFRSPEPDAGVADSFDGVLAAVSVNTNEGSTRPTESALRLGAPEMQVLGTHEGQLDPVTGPPGQQVYLLRAPDGSERGIAYVTDGAQLIKINVGFLDVVAQPETCPA